LGVNPLVFKKQDQEIISSKIELELTKVKQKIIPPKIKLEVAIYIYY